MNKLPQQLHVMQPTSSSVMQVGGCNICGGTHESGMCMAQEDASKEVNYMANPNRQGFHQGRNSGYHQGGNFSQNQGHGWRSHPRNNFNKDEKGSSNWPPNKGPNLYERTTKLEDTFTQFMLVLMLNHKSIESAIKNLEVLVGPLAKQLAEKSTGNFVANTEKNPKEDCKAVLTRNKRKEGIEKEKRAEGEVEDVSDYEVRHKYWN